MWLYATVLTYISNTCMFKNICILEKYGIKTNFQFKKDPKTNIYIYFMKEFSDILYN